MLAGLLDFSVEKYCYSRTGNRSQKRRSNASRVRYLPGLECYQEIDFPEKAYAVWAISMGALRLMVSCTKPMRISYGGSGLNGHRLLELDSKGRQISCEEYYPFGGTCYWAARSQREGDDKIRRYAAKERDITGLVYYGYRYFAPWLLRWLNTDPAGTVDGLNLLRMCSNNPVSRRDIDGRMENEDWESFFARLLNGTPRLPDNDHLQDNLPEQYSLLHNPEPQPQPDSFSPLMPLPVYPASEPQAGTSGNSAAPAKPEVAQSLPQPPAERSGWICPHAGCNKPFPNQHMLNRHLTSHDMTLPFCCQEPDCLHRFKKQSLLKQHQQVHEPKRFACQKCDARFSRNEQLKVHITHIHSDQRLFECNICHQRFKSRGNLRGHAQVHTDSWFRCTEPNCLKKYRWQKSLNEHFLDKHAR